MARKSDGLRAALLTAPKRRDCNEADRKHLKRWLKNIELVGADPQWSALEARAISCGMAKEHIYVDFVAYALDARNVAEHAESDRDPVWEERQRQRDELLALADKTEELAKYFLREERYSGIATFFQRDFLPVRSLWLFHIFEAKLLRRLAGREPRPSTFISRQSGGRNRRSNSRAINAFVSFMTDRMFDECGRVYRRVLVEMTNAAFPKADVSESDVRWASRMKRARSRKAKSETK
jgi:hypothetical protein